MFISRKHIKHFLHQESSGGILLMIAAALALTIANSPAAWLYDMLITTPVEIRLGSLDISKPLILWVNDGLMAAFFFLVGLELKKEIIEGELSRMRDIVLPAIGAVGGMVVPAAIYIYFNYDNPINMQGWAIPAATDIAFALGILTLLGSRVPVSLKILLASLAIFDDIGAIIIIAIWYTQKIYMPGLVIVAICTVILFFINRKKVENTSIYIFIGSIMWVAMLKSGVHATLTGVLLAMFIPMRSAEDPEVSPLLNLEHDLHGAIAFVVLPVFAFMNSGIAVDKLSLEIFTHSVPLGISLGLFIGKPLGIFGFIWLAVQVRLVKLPESLTWMSLLGMSYLAGVGFTMSLFIGSLAFDPATTSMFFDERLGIVAGSILSGVAGYLILKKSLKA